LFVLSRSAGVTWRHMTSQQLGKNEKKNAVPHFYNTEIKQSIQSLFKIDMGDIVARFYSKSDDLLEKMDTIQVEDAPVC